MFPPYFLLLLFLINRIQVICCSPTVNISDDGNANVTTDAAVASNGNLDERGGAELVKKINEESDRQYSLLLHALWNFNSDDRNETRIKMIEAQKEHGAFSKIRWQLVNGHKNVWPTFKNESLKRQFQLFSVIGTAALPKPQYTMLNAISNKMQEIYGTGRICDYRNSTKCDLSFQPDIENILKTSRDFDELTYVWKAWRDAVGKPNRMFFDVYTPLANLASNMNGYPTAAEMLLAAYESATFESDIAALLEDLSPLYKQLHAYTRRKLREIYGEEKVSKTGPLPAHILGDMWAESWDKIYDVLVPYPNKTYLDVTQSLLDKAYTPKKIFEVADDFFASINLDRVPESFWNLSIFKEIKNGKEQNCQASTWDFLDGKDFRIKQCTELNMENFYLAHQKMGQLQYFMQYKDLPHPFKRGANGGFNEAVGDVIGLSISTPKHLHSIGLLENNTSDEESELNFLLKSALQKVPFLPFAYLIDKWRWDVYRGIVSANNYTCTWWNYRYRLQGVAPPVTRTEEDFDPAAKFHVVSQYNYISYFVSYVIQFQIHKAACIKAGQYDPNDPAKPLHQCDIYQSVEAGNALRDMLKLGGSEPWQVPLKLMTGEDKMSISALREYFLPLEKWLTADNAKHGEFIGWEGVDDFCKPEVAEDTGEYVTEEVVEDVKVDA